PVEGLHLLRGEHVGIPERNVAVRIRRRDIDALVRSPPLVVRGLEIAVGEERPMKNITPRWRIGQLRKRPFLERSLVRGPDLVEAGLFFVGAIWRQGAAGDGNGDQERSRRAMTAVSPGREARNMAGCH